MRREQVDDMIDATLEALRCIIDERGWLLGTFLSGRERPIGELKRALHRILFQREAGPLLNTS